MFSWSSHGRVGKGAVSDWRKNHGKSSGLILGEVKKRKSGLLNDNSRPSDRRDFVELSGCCALFCSCALATNVIPKKRIKRWLDMEWEERIWDM